MRRSSRRRVVGMLAAVGPRRWSRRGCGGCSERLVLRSRGRRKRGPGHHLGRRRRLDARRDQGPRLGRQLGTPAVRREARSRLQDADAREERSECALRLHRHVQLGLRTGLEARRGEGDPRRQRRLLLQLRAPRGAASWLPWRPIRLRERRTPSDHGDGPRGDTADVQWEGAALGAYDSDADRAFNLLFDSILAGDNVCKSER